MPQQDQCKLYRRCYAPDRAYTARPDPRAGIRQGRGGGHRPLPRAARDRGAGFPQLFPLALQYPVGIDAAAPVDRSEEHTSELQSLMRISYAVFCLKKKTIPGDVTADLVEVINDITLHAPASHRNNIKNVKWNSSQTTSQIQ